MHKKERKKERFVPARNRVFYSRQLFIRYLINSFCVAFLTDSYKEREREREREREIERIDRLFIQFNDDMNNTNRTNKMNVESIDKTIPKKINVYFDYFDMADTYGSRPTLSRLELTRSAYFCVNSSVPKTIRSIASTPNIIE
jgi:hypothetical protein